MGDINMRATDEAVSELTGKGLPKGILPAKACVKFKKEYLVGRKRNALLRLIAVSKKARRAPLQGASTTIFLPICHV